MKRYYYLCCLFVFAILLYTKDLSAENWMDLECPAGGGANRIVKNNGKLFAVRDNKLYYSNDNAKSWNLSEDPYHQENVNLLEKDSKGNLYLFIETKGLFKSIDNGVSWNSYLEGSDTLSVASIYFPNDSTIFLGSYLNQFLKSDNNGKSWSIVNYPSQYTFYKFVKSPNNMIFAHVSTDQGYIIIKSSDNGNSWSQCDSSFIRQNYILNFTVNAKGWLFGGSFFGLFCSKDDGNSWSKLENEIRITSVQSILSGKDSNMYLADNGSQVFWSNDYGASWKLVEKDISLTPVSLLDIDDDGVVYLNVVDGLYLSDDNLKNWKSSYSGFRINSFSNLLLFGERMIATSSLMTHIYDFNTKEWKTIKKGTNFQVLYYSPDSVLHLCSDRGGYYRSTDNGNTLEQLYSNYTTTSRKFVTDKNGILYAICGNKISKSSDKGVSWSFVLEPNKNNPTFFDGDIAENGEFYVVASDSNLYRLKSRDTTLERISLKEKMFFNQIYLFDRQSIFLCNDNGITKTDDSFSEFRNVFETNERILKICTDRTGKLFAITMTRIVVSADQGENWTDFETNFNHSFSSIDFDAENTIFISSYGKGIKYSNSTTTVNYKNELSSSLILIIPNPASDFIEISYPINDVSFLRMQESDQRSSSIRIFDVFGELINPTPALPGVEGGSSSSSHYSLLTTQYSPKIDVSSLSPGLYFVRLGERTGKFIKY